VTEVSEERDRPLGLFRRLRRAGQPARSPTTCEHLRDGPTDAEPRTPQGCEECLRDGTRWVQLRLCLSCGHVGCCDSSPERHGTGHFRETGHPVMRSFEPGESWRWCFVDNLLAE